MNGINLDALEDSEADIDLRRCPAEQVGILLDLVRFDRFLDYVYATLLKRDPDREGRVLRDRPRRRHCPEVRGDGAGNAGRDPGRDAVAA